MGRFACISSSSADATTDALVTAATTATPARRIVVATPQLAKGGAPFAQPLGCRDFHLGEGLRRLEHDRERTRHDALVRDDARDDEGALRSHGGENLAQACGLVQHRTPPSRLLFASWS